MGKRSFFFFKKKKIDPNPKMDSDVVNVIAPNSSHPPAPILYIPVKGSDVFVELTREELVASDSNDILELLRAELAPLKVWHQIAVCGILIVDFTLFKGCLLSKWKG